MAKLNGRLQLFQNNFHAIPIKGIGNKEQLCTFGFTKLCHMKLLTTLCTGA